MDLKLIQDAVKNKLPYLIQDVGGHPGLVAQVRNAYSRFENAPEIVSILEADSGLLCNFSEVAYPLESIQSVEPPIHTGGFRTSEVEWARKALEGEAVVGLDTSEVTPSTHRSPEFLLTNLGFSLIYYAQPTLHVEGSRPFFFPVGELLERCSRSTASAIPSWTSEILRIDCEQGLLSELSSGYGVDRGIFALFDESFTASYLSTVSKTRRSRVVKALDATLKVLMERRIVPIGVFYTSSSAFTAMVRKCLVRPEDHYDLEDWRRVRDRSLFVSFLPPGWRSPTFMLRNRLADEYDRRILGFYLNAGANSVVRVEFPEAAFRQVEDIHRVVLAQSALGGGYPYVLQRAHEQAYMNPGERKWILDYINRLLREESDLTDPVTLSKKETRKMARFV